MSDNTKLELYDYSSLKGVLGQTKLQKSNSAAYQVLNGLIGGAQVSNDFIKQQFTDINGQQTSIQDGLQSVLDTVSAQNAQIAALTSAIAAINVVLTNIGVILNDRNNAAYGCSSFNSGAQTLTTGVEAAVVLDSNIFGSLRSGNTFVAPAAAQYMVSGEVIFEPNVTGTRRIRLSSSGGISLIVSQITGNGADNVVCAFAALVGLGAGESIQANAIQDSGGNLAAAGAMQIFRVSYV
jgi:hypothetical protein